MNYTHYETADNGMEFKVHTIRAGTKEYVCPGCNGIIMVGESHVVAWTEDSWFGPQAGQEARRHWHTSCWRAKGRRSTGF
ncbi:ATP/GTP-binding protein [Trueperella bernardiae]|nr:ATP/GTP-binding protein [Trueperella bernardiae]